MAFKGACSFRSFRLQRPQFPIQFSFHAFSSRSGLHQIQHAFPDLKPPHIADDSIPEIKDPLLLPWNTELASPSHLVKRSPAELKHMRKTALLSGTIKQYDAYCATDKWLQAIHELVGYDMPQVKSEEDVPKLEGGEEIGVPLGNGSWYKELDLIPTFNTWAQLTILHLWVLQTRVRTVPAQSAKNFSQHLTDHFFITAETKMQTLHKISSSSVRSKYLKDLYDQWRGVMVAYDEGLVRGDAVLAASLWRNLFAGREDVDPVKLAMAVSWVRREVARVGHESDYELWSKFGYIEAEKGVVLKQSKSSDKP